MKVEILGVKIDNLNFREAIKKVGVLIDDGKKHYAVTPNPEFLVAAHSDLKFREILNKADLAVPDGIGLLWASRLLDKPLCERVTGTDLVDALCGIAAKKSWKVGFLGAGSGVAGKAASVLKEKYPKLKVVLACEEWENNFSVAEVGYVDLLFVAFGQVKQEKWIAENLDRIPVKVAMGIGGALDFIAGNKKRAPLWVRKMGLEWLFRLIQEPWRIRRQLALPYFVWLVLKEKMTE